MAVVTTKSSAITGLDAKPAQPQNARLIGGPLQSAAATVELGSADSINSQYRLFRVPSGVCLRSLTVYCDAITSAAANIGVYRTASDGGAVVNATAFAAAASIATAISLGSNLLFQGDPTNGNANDMGLASIEKMLWQVLNLAADPYVEYDIVVTLTAAATAAGTLSAHLTFVR
jgi:hypothetical protein